MSDKACKATARLYDNLASQSPIIKIVRRDDIDSRSLYQNQTEDFHDDLNDGWAKPLIHYNSNRFELQKSAPMYTPLDLPLELDPSDTKEKNESNQIDKSKVQEFLNIQPTPKIEGVKKLGEVTKPKTKFPFEVNLPEEVTDIKCLITIKLNKLEINNLLPTDEMSGFIQIYDFDAFTPLSEPVYFTFNDNEVKLSQTNQDLVYVPIRNIHLNLTICCFILKKSKDFPVPRLFACNRSSIFDRDRKLRTDIEFSQNWYLISNCKDIQSMFTPDETQQNNLVKIKSEIEVKQISDMNSIKDMNFTYSWKEKSDLNFSALPLYPLPDAPSPVGSIYNLHFVLNKPPPNSELYMKAIAVNEEGEINLSNIENSANKLPIFPIQISQTRLQYISSSVNATTEFSLPDCMRIFVGPDICENTIIVIFIMSRETKKDKVKESVYKVGVIQLQNEEAELQTTQRIPLFEYKKFPKKYLSQQKKQNKTYLQYTIALPPVFFPTPFCRQLFKASANNIPDFPQDTHIHLSSVIIPVVAKLLSIQSEKALPKLLQLLEMFRNSPVADSNPAAASKNKKDKKPKDKNKKELNLTLTTSMSLIFNGNPEYKRYFDMLSYWIYNNFDASTCKPDLFCQYLRNYIQSNVIRMNSIREKCENAKEVIHESSSGNFDLSQMKIKTSSSNFGESKKDVKRESKKDKKNNLLIQGGIFSDLMDAKNSLTLISNNIEIILDVVCATVAHYIKLNRELLKDEYTPNSQPIVIFFKEFSDFLIELDWLEIPQERIIKIATKFTQVLFMVQTFFTNKELGEIVLQNFYNLSSYVDQNKRTNALALKIQLTILQGLFTKPNFIVASASLTNELSTTFPFSPYNKVFGQIFLMTHNIFKYNIVEKDTKELFSMLCGNLSILTEEMESIYDPKILAHICYFFLPFILNISSYYDQLSSIPELQESIIPFILIVLNNCDTKFLYEFYHNLMTINKTNFISFLKSISNVSLKAELRGKYNYIKQISQRILNILLTLVDDLGAPIEPVVDLIELLLIKNEFQTPMNYPNFYNFVSQLMTKQKCDSKLILVLLTNIRAKYHSLRCLCASLLSWQINADYIRNKDIVYSSIDILDSLTAILLKLEPEELQIYKELISLLSDLAPNYNDSQFTSMVTESMKTAGIIADVIEKQKLSNQPPEVRCRQTMRIADQYKLIPSMRIKWLQQVLSINLENENYVSAFITQMHIVALLTTIYDYKRKIELKDAGMNIILNNDSSELIPDPPFHLMIVRPIENAYPKTAYTHSQPYLDFEFLPEVASETELKFDEFTAGAWGLMNGFNFQMLQDEINKAFEFGMKAELYYSLRPLLSLLMRIFYVSRNFDGMSKASGLLQKALYGVTFESCTLMHDISVQFYLVETKNGTEEQPARQVFCVKMGDLKKRTEFKEGSISAAASQQLILTPTPPSPPKPPQTAESNNNINNNNENENKENKNENESKEDNNENNNENENKDDNDNDNKKAKKKGENDEEEEEEEEAKSDTEEEKEHKNENENKEGDGTQQINEPEPTKPDENANTTTTNQNENENSVEVPESTSNYDQKFIEMIYSPERFGSRKLKVCDHHDPSRCFSQSADSKVCVVRLEPTDSIPVDYEDPHCWRKFQTRVTRKMIMDDTDNDKLHIVVIETKDPAPHYKMTIDVTDFKLVEKTKAEVVTDVALHSAAVLDVMSENLESYFEYEDAENWNISPDESYNYEFVDKLHILQSVLGMSSNGASREEDDADDASILGLLTALKVKHEEDAERIVRETIQPSLRRALMIFLRGKKELTSMQKFVVEVDRTLRVANEFLRNFNAEKVKEDEFYMSDTNSVWQKFRFEKDMNY